MLSDLVLSVNTTKSFCLRIGPRFDANCCAIEINGQRVAWSAEVRYLGIFFVAGRRCEVSFDSAKRSFNRGVNAILGRIGTRCDIHLLTHLIDAKCTPALLYGVESCGVTQMSLQSLDFVFKRYFFKVFKTSTVSVVDEALAGTGILLPSAQVVNRTKTFISRFSGSDNLLCKHVWVLHNSKVSCSDVFSSVNWSLYAATT